MEFYSKLKVCWIIAACILVNQSSAQSLFPIKQANEAMKGSSSATAASLYSDLRAHGVGDILTITVAEQTSASATANTQAAQNESVNAMTGASGLIKQFFGSLGLSAGNSRTATGTGATSRTGNIVTTLSVKVVEVLPNGTLRVEGKRVVAINKETQEVTFSGLVRPEDIGSDNSIPSNLVADAKVTLVGKGMVGNTQKPGFLTRLFRFLF